jgi:hypothetical protein
MADWRTRIVVSSAWLLAACAEPPARAPVGLHMHRLNTTEYANSLAAVLGVESQVARSLPADAPSHGFDNIAEVLTTSPLLFEFYAQATDEALELALEGPLGAEVASCSEQHDDDHCASTIVERLATLAWRRPPNSTELDRLLAVYDEARVLGLDLDESIAAALQAVLSSPYFLFRIEATSAPGSSEPLDPYELASRLSYFLWSGPPDDALLAQARSGALLDPAVLESEARRMLVDPRAEALADNFAAQWLGFRYLDDVFKDTARFPDFTPALRASMAEEPRRSFLDLLERDRDLRELLTRDDSFVDSRLAALYGLDQPEPGFVRVDLSASASPRRGLLTQAGLLSTLAYPFTTSPARRGAWVLDSLLCTPIAAPPPGVDVPIDLDAAGKREQLEAHRASPACAVCHTSIDPIGLAFEGYDAIGNYLATDDGPVIDTAGSLPSGVAFADPIEMATAIAEDPAFVPCVVQQTMTYALGRGLGEREHDEVDELALELAARGHGLQELFVLVATSEVFRTRIEEDPAS